MKSSEGDDTYIWPHRVWCGTGVMLGLVKSLRRLITIVSQPLPGGTVLESRCERLCICPRLWCMLDVHLRVGINIAEPIRHGDGMVRAMCIFVCLFVCLFVVVVVVVVFN